ncbi:MAG: hypothetical protein ACLRZ9_04110 [Eubacterium sp.]
MNTKVYYCKKCGSVYGDEFNLPRQILKGKCPQCKNTIYQTKEDISYFQGRVEKTLPTWKDVVRNKYLNKNTIDACLYNKRAKNEISENELKLKKLKNNTDSTNYLDHSMTIEVECPYCKSTDTKKITTTSKAVYTAIFGIWSMGRNSKNYHCNNCNSDF